ncbi:MAG: FlgD immunoglobulin-like domain containing protein [bacterium]
MLIRREIITLIASFAACSTLYAQQWSIPEKLPPPINAPGSESSFSFITRDSKRLYFASDRITRSTEDIYYSDWDGEKWAEPVRLGPNINTPQRELSPTVTADGKVLYFTRYTNSNSYDIYYSMWQDTSWGQAVNMGAPINTTFAEWSCSISEDGMTLIFDCYHYRHSADPQVNPPDLCFSVKADTGWTYPKLIFDNYEDNSGWEVAPSLSNDGKIIYFQRLGNSPWEREIWYTKFEGGAWQPSVNIGPPINTPEAEIRPSISSDGNTLYFTRIITHPPVEGEQIYMSHRLPNAVKSQKGMEEINSVVLSSYPNPFNSQTKFHLQLARNQWLEIKIYDINGKEIRSLASTFANQGKFEATWDGVDNHGHRVTSGIYFCRVILGGELRSTLKILMLN